MPGFLMDEFTFEIIEKVKEVTNHLGNDWTLEQPESNFWLYVNHLEGGGLGMRYHKERLQIFGLSARSPDREHFSSYDKEITCSVKRPAEAIAKDINDRFIPNYLQWYTTAEEKEMKYYREREECRKQTTKIAGILNFEIHPECIKQSRFNKSLPGRGTTPGIKVEVHNDHVHLNLKYLSWEQAESICQILNPVS